MNSQVDHEGLALTPADINSHLWQRIEQHLNIRLEAARIRNDAPLSHEETLALRGRIQEIKSLLAAGSNRD